MIATVAVVQKARVHGGWYALLRSVGAMCLPRRVQHSLHARLC